MGWGWTDAIDDTTPLTDPAFFNVFVAQANARIVALQAAHPSVPLNGYPVLPTLDPSLDYPLQEIEYPAGAPTYLDPTGYTAAFRRFLPPLKALQEFTAPLYVVTGQGSQVWAGYRQDPPETPNMGHWYTRVRPREIMHYQSDSVTSARYYPYASVPQTASGINYPAMFRSPAGFVECYTAPVFIGTLGGVPLVKYLNPNAGQSPRVGARAMLVGGGLRPPFGSNLNLYADQSRTGQQYRFDGTEWVRDEDGTPDLLWSTKLPPDGLIYIPCAFPGISLGGTGPPFLPTLTDPGGNTWQYVDGAIGYGDIFGPWLFQDLRDIINLNFIDNARRGLDASVPAYFS